MLLIYPNFLRQINNIIQLQTNVGIYHCVGYFENTPSKKLS